MKLELSQTMTALVEKYSAKSSLSDSATLHFLTSALREATAFKAHHMSATAFDYIQKAEQADTLHYALSCVTAASADLLNEHLKESSVTIGDLTPVSADKLFLKDSFIDNATVQVDSLATATRTHYPHLCQQIEALDRYDMDQSDCDSCGQDCGADMVIFDDGDYLRREDVLRILGGII
ncbi:MAG: hypothetical protein [Bacteriophage sp.]|nr:MAG: hypothetical protein [Bacteriophage sp.]